MIAEAAAAAVAAAVSVDGKYTYFVFYHGTPLPLLWPTV